MNILYLGGFRDSTRTESHVASALREWGHDVTEYALNARSVRALKSSIEQSAHPDIVLWTYDSQLIPETSRQAVTTALKVMKILGIMTAAFHLDRYWDLVRETCITDEPWFKCDLVLTADGGNQQRFLDAGVNHLWMPPAVHGPDVELIGTPRDEYRCKVAFVGSWERYHPEWPWRMEMIELLRHYYGADFRTFPEIRTQQIRGQDLNDLYASVDVVVGDSIFAGTTKGHRYSSDRPFETLGRGGCLAMPRCDLETIFRDGEHLRYFDAGNAASMFTIIDELLADPDQRAILRKQGRAEVFDNHLYRHRTQEMVQRIVEHRPSLVGWNAGVRPNTYDAVAIRETWYDDCYRAREHIHPGDTVVDLGANVGAFSIWAALQGANVIAVEPIPENVIQLKQNIAAMGVSDKVTILNTAVGEKHGVIAMAYLSPDRSQSAFRTERTDEEVLHVPVLPLSDILPDSKIAFLKVDIEGSEVFALQGADLSQVQRIAVETHQFDRSHTTHKEIMDILDEARFRLSETGGDHDEGYIHGWR